ncbi:MAG: tRNA1(Val) (adenine(37)-N6)-methyltransferase [Bacillota bacterium]
MKENETVDDLILSGLKIIQKKNGFRFSIDSVLLTHFPAVKKGDRIIDLGTGTGVVPLLMSTRGEDLALTGIEIQEEIAEMARRSVELNNLSRVEIIQGDLRKLNKEMFNHFNLVVSNPPYLPVNQGKVSPQPEVALARHEIMCTLSELVQTAKKLLKEKGRLAMVHRAERLGEIMYELHKHGLCPSRLRLVYPHLDKHANLVLIEAVKGSGVSLKVEKPLIVYKDETCYTDELLNYYFGGGTCEQ